MNTNQFYPMPYNQTPYSQTPYQEVQEQPQEENEERFLPFLAGLAITAPFWAGGWGRRCCAPFPVPFPYPVPFTFNTYQGVVGSPYSFYYGRPFVY